MKDRYTMEKELADLKKSFGNIIQANTDLQDENKLLKRDNHSLLRIIEKLEKHLLEVYESFIDSKNEDSYIVATESKLIYDYLQELKNERY